MNDDVVVYKYGPLEKVAAQFGQLADEAGQTFKDVNARFEELRGGGWQGQAADAHFTTAEEDLFPALKRLARAYETGAQALRESAADMREVDEAGGERFRGR